MKNWEKSNCWVWPFSKNRDRYGQITINKKYHSAHKWMYEKLISNVPHGCELDHLCKNPTCVNPLHLEPVSHVENCRRGNNHKLNSNDIKKIKSMSSKYSQKYIANKFKISRSMVGLILQGKRWN